MFRGKGGSLLALRYGARLFPPSGYTGVLKCPLEGGFLLREHGSGAALLGDYGLNRSQRIL